MVELRKRKAAPAPEPPAKKKAAAKGKAGAAKLEEALTKAGEAVSAAGAKAAATANGSAAPKAGDTVALDGFGGAVDTHDGRSVTLKQLVEESDSGVVLFTYPKANTPGCTTQACAFRDGYAILTKTGLAIYGLSGDGPKANSSFVAKQSLPYDLLCDPKHTLIAAIGMSAAGKTKRGVFVVDKQGKVLEAMQGGPLQTVDAAQKIVAAMGKANGESAKNGEKKEDAETAAKVDA